MSESLFLLSICLVLGTILLVLATDAGSRLLLAGGGVDSGGLGASMSATDPVNASLQTRLNRTCFGTDEALPRNGGIVLGERAQMQRVLHVGREIRGGQCDLRSLLPKGSAGADLCLRSSMPGTF